MDRNEFNVRCAKRLGIFYSNNEVVFVEWEDEAMPREFDPYYDANDREVVIEDMGIDTTYLRDMEVPEWQCRYGTENDIEIEVSETIAGAQRACITNVLMQA